MKLLKTNHLNPATPAHIKQVYKDYTVYKTAFGWVGVKKK